MSSCPSENSPATLVRRYYAALDSHDYDELETILAPEFVQRRPDRTFETRAAFVRFMRDDRPTPDTRHELEELVVEGDGDTVVARGRVIDMESTNADAPGSTDSDVLLSFVDTFTVESGRLVRLETRLR
ncbi:nuclear transport factor 2 family protein [Natronosalvus vescus]|uniref:nuclear transport factor 2 family protein n=1 Tax=Natronosalvus vescus TaxID=2953881 RepID=UPI0020916E93|nr:nuclear transport factor 2 family protein [Natronosalvus vescus]